MHGQARGGGTTATEQPELVLSGPRTPARLLLRNVWASRELIVILGRKNFFVQYRRTSIGVLWAIGLPLVQAIVLSFVFSRVTNFKVDHYAVYVLSGMVAWGFFMSILGPGATCIVDSAGLSSKVYFPRAVLPLAQCVSAAYTLVASLSVLVVIAAIVGADFGWRTLFLVPGALLVGSLAAGFALVLSVVNVYVRDVRYLVQAASLVWLWVTPIVYPFSLVSGALQTVLILNPMTGVAQLFHAAFVADVGPLYPALVTVGWIAALWSLALLLHCRHDRVLADLL